VLAPPVAGRANALFFFGIKGRRPLVVEADDSAYRRRRPRRSIPLQLACSIFSRMWVDPLSNTFAGACHGFRQRPAKFTNMDACDAGGHLRDVAARRPKSTPCVRKFAGRIKRPGYSIGSTEAALFSTWRWCPKPALVGPQVPARRSEIDSALDAFGGRATTTPNNLVRHLGGPAARSKRQGYPAAMPPSKFNQVLGGA